MLTSSPTDSQKYFTEHSANSALVFVRAVAEDIVAKWENILTLEGTERDKHFERLGAGQSPNNMADAQLLIDEIHYHTRELTAMGCYLKDLGKGIVLFPTKVHGERSYYVWKVGENKVRSVMQDKQSVNR